MFLQIDFFLDKMEEEEIDIWYNEKKEEALKQYLQDIEKNQNKKEAENKYKYKMQRYRQIYEKKYEKSKEKNFFVKYMEGIKEFMDKLASIYKE